MKRFFTVLLIFMVFFSLTIAYGMESEFDPLPDVSKYESRIMIDGKYLINTQAPITTNGHVLIPMRRVLENSGYTVTWFARSNRVLLLSPTNEKYWVELTTGKLYKNQNLLFTDDKLVVKKGQTYVSKEFFSNLTHVDVQWDRASKTLVVVTKNPTDNLFVYNLGQNTLEVNKNKTITYEMQGIVGVPKGKNRPMAIILHGSHPIERASENRYDLGFSYLVDALADAGYLAISMNVGMNYSFEKGEPVGYARTLAIVEQQTELLKRAISGEKDIFPCDLTAKGNMDNVILIGHSRGGTDMFEVAANTQNFKTTGFLSIAPSVVFVRENEIADVPTSIILPQYDGDVSRLDGATIYNELAMQSHRRNNAELIYLKNADHGGFNSSIILPDPFASADDIEKSMSDEEQRSFITKYAIDFMNAVTKSGNTPLSDVVVIPSKLYEKEILASIFTPNSKQVYFAEDSNMKNISMNSSEIKIVDNSSFYGQNTAGNFKAPGFFEHYKLLNMKWYSEKARVDFYVNSNITNFSSLLIDLAQDSSDEINGSRDIGCTVILTDRFGKTSEYYCSPGTPALRYQQGELLCDDNWDGGKEYYYSTFTPLSTLKIPLESFSGIDFNSLVSISLSFDKTEGGSIMIRKLSMF